MKITTAIFASMFVSAAAVAAPLGSDIGRDPDGAYDRGESLERAQNAENAVFTALDQNGDDSLDKNEAQVERTLRYDFDEVDANSDGSVSRDEFLANREALKTDIEEAE